MWEFEWHLSHNLFLTTVLEVSLAVLRKAGFLLHEYPYFYHCRWNRAPNVVARRAALPKTLGNPKDICLSDFCSCELRFERQLYDLFRYFFNEFSGRPRGKACKGTYKTNKLVLAYKRRHSIDGAWHTRQWGVQCYLFFFHVGLGKKC